MKKLIMCTFLCLVLLVPVLAQKGRSGNVCADGNGLMQPVAEYYAWQNCESACVIAGGQPSYTKIVSSQCYLFGCQATACTTCRF